MQTLRFADPRTVTQYPLTISVPVRWQPAGTGVWEADVDLPLLGPGEILTPSLSVLDRDDYRFRFVLITPSGEYPLPPVPANRDNRSDPDPSDEAVRTVIDCFHLARSISGSRLNVRFEGSAEPDRYLLVVSWRSLESAPIPTGSLESVRTRLPPSRSQMLANPRIARRICSPMSTAMVMGTHLSDVDYGAVVEQCLDPLTGMYGSWPLAIRTASRAGLIGAVELLTGWEPVLACLRRGLPVVASIRYGHDALPGAPQPATQGHLVVVHGVDGESVLVNDPAAPHHGSVIRRLPIDAFADAWFRHRGAAYILTP